MNYKSPREKNIYAHCPFCLEHKVFRIWLSNFKINCIKIWQYFFLFIPAAVLEKLLWKEKYASQVVGTTGGVGK